MLERILIAGAGGQGIILTGKMLASVAMESVENVTFFPSYGAEVRGGTSHCEVILSSRPIASPVSEVFDVMIIMNQASADRFLPQATADTTVYLNTSMCRQGDALGRIVGAGVTEKADEVGSTRVANFIMLGVYVADRHAIDSSGVERAIKRLLAGKDPELIELNMMAFREGLSL